MDITSPVFPRMTIPTVNGAGKSPHDDPKFLQTMNVLHNMMQMRQQIFGMLIDKRRNIDNECGYPTPESSQGQLTPLQYRRLHEFDWLAGTINELMANECFQATPELVEDENPETITELERSFYEELPATLSVEQSYYRPTPEMHPVWAAVTKAWVDANISRYGLLYIGFNDRRKGESLADWMRRPVDAVPYKKLPKRAKPGSPRKAEKDDGRRVLFFRSFPEDMCPVSTWVTDQNSPHFGEPETYSVTFMEVTGATSDGLTSAPMQTQEVHASRCIHLCPNPGVNPFVGHPNNERVIKPVLNITKIMGAHGEGSWKMAFSSVVFEALPGFSKYDTDAVKDAMEDWEHGLHRAFSLVGFNAKTLPPVVVDPRPGIEINLRGVSVRLRVPRRILEGSEVGQANSEQDKTEWKERVREFFNDRILIIAIIPLIDRLINVGALAPPAGDGGYVIKIPPLDAQTQSEKVNVASVVVNMLVAYLQGGADALIPPKYLLTTVLRGYFTDAEVDKMLEEAEKLVKEKAEADMEAQMQMQDATGGGDPALDGQPAPSPGNDAAGDQDGLVPPADPEKKQPSLKAPKPLAVNVIRIPPSAKHLSSGGKPARRVEFATPEERKSAYRFAMAKIKAAPKPSGAERVKSVRDAATSSRIGGEARGGNSYDRKAQRLNLFNEAGGKKKGYIVCPWTGLKMHWSDDLTQNPKGYPSFERGKIFVKAQGGGYQIPNLIAESYLANRTRGNLPMRR